nr:unnamed protein product [Callosobruchus chinensis]
MLPRLELTQPRTSSNNKISFADRASLCIVTSTVILILLIVIVGVIARFVLDEQVSRIVLICLICLLSVLGVGALTMLEIRRRKSTRKRKQALRDRRYRYFQTTAPPPPSQQDTSWEYSHRTTMPAS